MVQLRLSLVLLLACWYADVAQGQSFGHWHLPSTPGQFFGCGNGAGHHAPIVRTPGCCPPQVARVSFQPCRYAPPAYVQPGSCGNGPYAAHGGSQRYPQAMKYRQTIR